MARKMSLQSVDLASNCAEFAGMSRHALSPASRSVACCQAENWDLSKDSKSRRSALF